MTKKDNQFQALSPAVAMDIADANYFVFAALEHETAKPAPDAQMVAYLTGIARKLPINNSSKLVKYQ